MKPGVYSQIHGLHQVAIIAGETHDHVYSYKGDILLKQHDIVLLSQVVIIHLHGDTPI